MAEYTLLDTFTPDGFYCTQGYGVNASYYSKFNLLWHEGVDFGNTNKKVIIRTPISGKVILDDDDGRGNYGNNVKIWDSQQLCAIQICHMDYNKVSHGQMVKAGDLIGEMGATGNSTGEHVHFNFFRTNASGTRLYNTKTSNWGYLDPQHPLDSNPPKKIPGVGDYRVNWVKTLSSTGESMPDKTYTEEEMTAMRLERDKNWSLYQKEKQTSEEYRSEAQSRREDYDRLIEDLAKRLNLPVSSDRSDILAAVDRLLKVEEDLRIEQTNHKKTYETLNREKDELKAEIDQLRAEIERQQKQNETLLNRIDKLESRIEQHEQIRETTNRFSEWLESVLNIFRR